MRVFNLTDVPTSSVTAQGLLNAPIQVGGVVIAPGKSAEVAVVPMSDIQRLLTAGALALNSLPESYVKAKARFLRTKPTPPPERAQVVRVPTHRAPPREQPAAGTALPTFVSFPRKDTASVVPETVVVPAAVVTAGIAVSSVPEPDSGTDKARFGKKHRGK